MSLSRARRNAKKKDFFQVRSFLCHIDIAAAMTIMIIIFELLKAFLFLEVNCSVSCSELSARILGVVSVVSVAKLRFRDFFIEHLKYKGLNSFLFLRFLVLKILEKKS